MIRKEYLTVPLTALVPYANNPRQNEAAVSAVIASMQQCENLDPIEVDEDFVILSGHTRLKALQQLGYEMTGVLKISGLTEEQKRKYRLLANKTNEIAGWDFDKLAVELEGLDLDGFDFGFELESYEVDDFEQNMRDGEARQERTEEYEEFEKKFELKKTTDDCYTPDLVYDALAGWVEKTYGLKAENFVRPFYPGGDYQARIYGPDDVVVDNPPFSIMAEILRYYVENGIRFFLFAPTLTLFSSIAAKVTALPLGVTVTYDNGANVNTSFLTNLEPGGCA